MFLIFFDWSESVLKFDVPVVFSIPLRQLNSCLNLLKTELLAPRFSTNLFWRRNWSQTKSKINSGLGLHRVFTSKKIWLKVKWNENFLLWILPESLLRIIRWLVEGSHYGRIFYWRNEKEFKKTQRSLMEFCVSIINCYETEMLDMTTPRPMGNWHELEFSRSPSHSLQKPCEWVDSWIQAPNCEPSTGNLRVPSFRGTSKDFTPKISTKKWWKFHFSRFSLEICVLSQVSLNFKEFVNKNAEILFFMASEIRRSPAVHVQNPGNLWDKLPTSTGERRISSIEQKHHQPSNPRVGHIAEVWQLIRFNGESAACHGCFWILKKKKHHLMETTENSCKPQFLVTMWFVFFSGKQIELLVCLKLWNPQLLCFCC